MPSFDIVSKMNEVDLRNAVDNAVREVSTDLIFEELRLLLSLKT